MKTIYSDSYRHLVGILKKARIDQELTQTQLSSQLGKPQSYVSKYERGDRRLDVIEFLEVCKLLNADPHELINKINQQ